jgi:hypothetical protein
MVVISRDKAVLYLIGLAMAVATGFGIYMVAKANCTAEGRRVARDIRVHYQSQIDSLKGVRQVWRDKTAEIRDSIEALQEVINKQDGVIIKKMQRVAELNNRLNQFKKDEVNIKINTRNNIDTSFQYRGKLRTKHFGSE